MLALRLLFPAGRYNEDWPPSPFLLARNIAMLCLREFPGMRGKRLESVLNLLSAPVSFALPLAVKSTSGDGVSIDPDTPAYMMFDVDPTREQLFDLRQLLCFLKTLGETPTWIDADVDVLNSLAVNCRETGTGTAVTVETLSSSRDYSVLRKVMRSSPGWVEAILSDSALLSRYGLSSSPAASKTVFYIADGLLRHHRPESVTVAEFSLESTNLPYVTETLRLAELVRRKLMGISKKLNGEGDSGVSQKFSGKNKDGVPMADHLHARFLPYSTGGHGKTDKLLITAGVPFTCDELQALQRLTSIAWQGKSDVFFSLESFRDELPVKSRVWESATPFTTVRHHRKSRGGWHDWMKSELLREADNLKLQKPSEIHHLKGCCGRTPADFLASRKGTEHPNKAFFRLVFAEPVSGPFALGSLSHFGLGLFLPAGDTV